MSILGKEWAVKYQRKSNESLWSALLASRNIENTGEFFAEAQLEDLHDPFLFPDMQKSIDRIQEAIVNRERIIVYGDYDVDGISGSALLIHTLRFLGAEVSYRIPHRMKDGYGLHAKYVEELIAQKAAILITVDLGISNAEEIKLAQKNGIDVILTDHHAIPKKLPKAFTILHPKLADKYPFKELSGSGVAFKLASALLFATKNEDMVLTLIDLASLGTVADCVSLTGENRAIVKLGLKQMIKTKWDGLRAILKSSGVWGDQNFTSYTIGFQIGPRINASGRIDNPYWALQTLIEEGEKAMIKSGELERLNEKRKELTQIIYEEAKEKIDHTQPIIIAEGKNWSSGIVGLIAGKLQEEFAKPTFILEDRGEEMVGSARSFPGFHSVEAITKAEDLLLHFGGHEQAAGFHLKKENYEEFKKILLKHAEEFFENNDVKPLQNIDLELLPGEASIESCNKISSFAPFGIGNLAPIFLLSDVKVLEQRPVGAEKKHLKISVKFGDEVLDGIAFNFAKHGDALEKANRLLVSLEKNEWNGMVKPQIRLIDFA